MYLNSDNYTLCNCMFCIVFQKRQIERYSALRTAISELIDWRRQLMTGTFTHDHLRDMRLRITTHIDRGNRYRHTSHLFIYIHLLSSPKHLILECNVILAMLIGFKHRFDKLLVDDCVWCHQLELGTRSSCLFPCRFHIGID